jgi:hypothetical protein
MGWASGLQAGLQLGKAFKEGQERRAMEKIQGATANEIQDYSTAGTQQIQGLQASGAYDVEAIPAAPGQAPTLRYTPKQGLDLQGDMPAPAGASIDVAPQRLTEFLGQRYEGGLTPERMETIRTRAMANAMTDPMRRQQALQNVTAEERAQAAEKRSQLGFETQQEAALLTIAEQRRLKKERDDAEDRQKQMSKDWSDRLTIKDADGNVTGMRPPTDEDLMWAAQSNAKNLAAAGKTTEAMGAYKDFVATAEAQIKKQSAERTDAIRIAADRVNRGDLSGAKDFYDKFVPDGAKVKEFQENKDGTITVKRVDLNGNALPDTKTTRQELIEGLVAFNEPSKLIDYAQRSFMNNIQTEQLKLQKRQTAASEANVRISQENLQLAKEKEDRLAKPIQTMVDDLKAAGLEVSQADVRALAKLDKPESAAVKAQVDAILKSIDPLQPKSLETAQAKITDVYKGVALQERNKTIVQGLVRAKKDGNEESALATLRDNGIGEATIAGLAKEAGITYTAPTKAPQPAAAANVAPTSGINTSRTGTGETNPYVTTAGKSTGLTTGAPSVVSQVLPQVAQAVENTVGTTATATRYLQGKIDRNESLTPAETARARQLGLIK